MKGILLPLFLLLSCIALSGYSYGRIVAERSEAQQGVEIPIDPSAFAVFQGAHCVGSVRTRFEQGADGQQLKLEAVFSAQSAFRLTGALSFNELGQMVGSVLKASTGGGDFTVGTAGVNPIHAVIKGEIFDKPLKLQMELPGPIKVRFGKTSAVFFQPRGRILMQQERPADLLRRLSISVVSDDGTACPTMSPLAIPENLLTW